MFFATVKLSVVGRAFAMTILLVYHWEGRELMFVRFLVIGLFGIARVVGNSM